MAKLNDAQLLRIIQDTNLVHGWCIIWDTLTPKQRARAEVLSERYDNEQGEESRAFWDKNERPSLKRTKRVTY